MKEKLVLYLEPEVIAALRKIAFMLDKPLKGLMAEILESEPDKKKQPPE